MNRTLDLARFPPAWVRRRRASKAVLALTLLGATIPSEKADAIPSRAGHAPTQAAGAARTKPVTRAPARPPVGPLPLLPTIAKVAIDAAGERLLVTEDVRLPRGEWAGGDLDFYLAFGAPAAPVAIDSQLYSQEGNGIAVPLTHSSRCPPSAHLLLGPREMTGVVAHVPAAAFRGATATGDAILRIRTVLAPVRPDGTGGREVLVRLGDVDGQPLAVERIELGPSLGAISRASANLCGERADPYPLAVTRPGLPRLGITYPRPEAPWLATRTPTDSLCIRWSR